jgi:hypothetical protein
VFLGTDDVVFQKWENVRRAAQILSSNDTVPFFGQNLNRASSSQSDKTQFYPIGKNGVGAAENRVNPPGL